MRLTIKTKIFLSVFVVSLIFVVITFFIVDRFLRRIADNEITHNLESGKIALERFESLYSDLLTNHARSIAQAPYLKIHDVNAETVLYTAQELFEPNTIDLMLLINSEGKFLTGIGTPNSFSQDLQTFPGITEGLNGI